MNGNLITKTEFGKRLHKLRKRAEYKTPRELALALCGHPKGTKGLLNEEAKKVDRMRRNVQNWEDGKNIPAAQTLATLCNLLDCDPDYLLYKECDVPRKEVKSVSDATGLSKDATENLLGTYKYGPTNTHKALNLVLENERMWKFFGEDRPVEDTIEGINVLWCIAQYLCSGDDNPGMFMVHMDEGTQYPYQRVEISAANYVTHGKPLKALIDRANIEAINDALKQMRKAGETTEIGS